MRIITCNNCEWDLAISTKTEIKIIPWTKKSFETEKIKAGERYGKVILTCPECGKTKKIDARTRKLVQSNAIN